MSTSRFRTVSPHAYLTGILSGFAMFAATFVVDLGLARLGLHAEATLLDDLLLGLLVTILVLLLEVQHQGELRVKEEKLLVALEMNHHIRNALQTIIYLNSLNPDQEVAAKIHEASNRIEWALREVLPGEKPPATISMATRTHASGSGNAK